MKKNRGQNVMEYVLLLSVILAAILSTGFISNIRGSFKGYFDQAAFTITRH